MLWKAISRGGFTVVVLFFSALAAAASLGSSITYQGSLSESGGPANGEYDFQLRLHSTEVGTSQVGSTVLVENVAVVDGLFTVSPDFGNVFDGRELWLEIGIRPGASTGTFTVLSPRQMLSGAPYALGFAPGVSVDTEDSSSHPYVLNLINDSAAAEGDVIKAYSTNGEGIEGYSTGGASADSGVYGQSNGTGASDAGVRGYASGEGPGVYGQGVGNSSTSYGLRGQSSSTHGVYGDSSATSTAYFGGYFVGPKGVYGNAESTSGDGTYGYCGDGSNCWGARGHSTDGYGVQGNTSRSDQMYGLHTSDRIYAGAGYTSVNGHSLIVQNGGDGDLEVGDPVAVSGMTDAFEQAGTPLLQVRRAYGLADNTVIGVVETAVRVRMVSKPETVYERIAMPDPEGEEAGDVQFLAVGQIERKVGIQEAVAGPAAPGSYLVMRVQGLARVKADATVAAIDVGMPVIASEHGRAVQADAALRYNSDEHALIIGQAVEPLEAGTGLIWVLVSPR